jgi:hypothetical protein
MRDPSPAARVPVLLALLCLPIVVSCGETGVLEPRRRHGVAISVDRAEGSVNTEFFFQVEAAGPRLSQVTISFGDGDSYVQTAFGAVGLNLRRRKSYAAAGRYRIDATAELETGAVVSDNLAVTVLASPAPPGNTQATPELSGARAKGPITSTRSHQQHR